MKTHDTLPASILASLYPMPRPYLDEDDWYRWHHRDLATMDASTLRREERRVQRRLDYETDRSKQIWLEDRIEQVQERLTTPNYTQKWGRG